MTDTGLQGKKIALVAGADAPAGMVDGWREALERSGAVVESIGVGGSAVSPGLDYEALVVIGAAGDDASDRATAVPEYPRAVVQLARELAMVDKPIAAVGAGVALLVAADAIRGRTVVAPQSLRALVEGAGGHVDAGTSACDERLLTTRGGSAAEGAARMVQLLSGAVTQLAVDRTSEASFPASDPPASPTSI